MEKLEALKAYVAKALNHPTLLLWIPWKWTLIETAIGLAVMVFFSLIVGPLLFVIVFGSSVALYRREPRFIKVMRCWFSAGCFAYDAGARNEILRKK